MANWEPDKTGREPGGALPKGQDPLPAPDGTEFLTDSPVPSRPAHRDLNNLRTLIPRHFEISHREREDEQRRHRDEFDEDYFADDPFGKFIQGVLDGKETFGTS